MSELEILIADDHELVRRGIRAVLKRERRWRIVGEAADGLEAVETAKRLKPDVVVLDISMPKVDGLEATRRIREAAPRTEILILTMHESDQIVRRVLEAGARGYVLKSDLARQLVAAVKAVSRRRRFLTPKASEIVLEGFLKAEAENQKDKRGEGRLTRRELEILRLLAESKSNKEVAAALDIAVRTVETHRANIMRKLDLHSTTDLVRYAIRHSITEA